MVAVLAACGEARAPGSEAAASELGPRGQYRAASESARALTGDVAIERGGLIFGNGGVFYTRALDPRRGGDLTARGGATYAAMALGASELQVELRRIVEAQGLQLCGEGEAAYVALVHDGRPHAVTLLVFAGEEPPGPEATASRLCGSFAYHAPNGVRTRDGVVLR